MKYYAYTGERRLLGPFNTTMELLPAVRKAGVGTREVKVFQLEPDLLILNYYCTLHIINQLEFWSECAD